ncbi:MAG: hypothetical protein OXI73_13860, partial [Rhodospirillales bacterium]|nr:hypothetical protein [Rhodospirillales bacterium]
MNRTIPLEVRPEQESEPQARHKSPSDSECKGALERFSLGHELVTDVVRLQFSDLCDEWDAYSVAYAVLLGAATTLDVPDTDLNATIARFEHEFLDDGFDEPTPDAEQVKLLSHFPRARSCVYWYDYGDDWMHT